jgi:cytochrome P450
MRDFVYSLFGPNILFSDAKEAKIYREIILALLEPLASEPNLNFLASLETLTKRWMVTELTTQDPIVMYSAFKRFATNLVLQTFLGVDEGLAPDLAARISELCTTHWHGIISVPMNVKVFSFLSR